MLLLKARERHAVDKNVPENMVEEEKRLEELSASILSWLVKGEMGKEQDMLRLGVCACEQPDLAIYYKASAYECFEAAKTETYDKSDTNLLSNDAADKPSHPKRAK
jgi:hypothetical protein